VIRHCSSSGNLKFQAPNPNEAPESNIKPTPCADILFGDCELKRFGVLGLDFGTFAAGDG
jgi:hypothetical protein